MSVILFFNQQVTALVLVKGNKSSKIIPAELATGVAVVCVWEGER
jgi:hypothetical protein